MKSRSKRKYVRNKEKKENKDGSITRELQKKNGKKNKKKDKKEK